MSENRVPITLRLSPADKAVFSDAATAAGLEPGTAARQIIEIVTRRIRAGSDYIDALQILNSALAAKPVVRVPAGSAPSLTNEEISAIAACARAERTYSRT